MNSLQAAASVSQRGAPIRANGSAQSLTPTSPTSPQQRGSTRTNASGRKRTLESAFGSNAAAVKVEPSQQSPTSVADSLDDKDESRIGVKRACNECRQQKLRCDVIQDPFQSCSRCKRCGLDCRIDSNFKRVGKRKRNAEMEHEIMELRRELEAAKQQHVLGGGSQIAQPSVSRGPLGMTPGSINGMQIPQISQSPLDQYMGNQEAVASLLDLKSGGEHGFGRSPGPDGKPMRRLENVVLTHTQVEDLFRVFYTYYHPLQPLLERDRSPDEYLEQCPLLFWTVIAVASRHHAPSATVFTDITKALPSLLWATIADVPQSYLVVKALCILCVWPLPISSTSADPTFMLAGLMLQISMQIGLHRPSHTQDFSKFRVDLREEELKDRVKTWAACNVVAQRVATGYGQPASTYYDWTLHSSGMKESGFRLPDEMDARLRIEMVCDKITKSLFGHGTDPVGFVPTDEKSELVETLANDLKEVESKFKDNLHSVNQVYLLAASMHLRLSVFFDSPDSPTYQQDLMHLWNATKKFLEQALNLSTDAGNILKYASNYILQMIVACAFTLLKLLNSFFARMINLNEGRVLFSRAIRAIRQISTVENDLTSRLAEVLAQMWRASGAAVTPSSEWDGTVDDVLQLKVRCRMSMSLVFDSVWRWREDFQAKGRGNLENALKNPTNPDSANASTVGTTGTSVPPSLPMDLATLGPSSKNLESMLVPTSASVSRAPTPSIDMGFGAEWNNEVFDPLNWMLDGVVDFPYVFGTEGSDLDNSLSI